MAPDTPADRPADPSPDLAGPDSAAEELAEQEERKQDEVLEREGVEQALMQEDRSEVGEELDDVQEETKGE